MTTTVLALVLGSLKALLLLVTATGLALALRTRPARLRVVVWSTALGGSLLIPLVAPLLPAVPLPLPFTLPSAHTVEAPAPATDLRPSAAASQPALDARQLTFRLPRARPTPASDSAGWHTWLVSAWIFGVAVVLAAVGIGLWRSAHAVSRARPVTDPHWLALLAQTREMTGCRRPVRLVASDQVEVPATIGLLRPVVVLPIHAHCWLHERRQAVLLHELVHVARGDWSLRLVARVARAVYWFNPLMWWAVRRLDLEQELACDEEVLALGTRASSYACHLLCIARAAVYSPVPAFSGLEMASRSQLEKRIMTILERTTHRKVGLAVLAPAALLMAAMVPALAAVHPSDPAPRPASPELKQILDEMGEVESRLEPYLERIESIEVEFEPHLEMIEDIEVNVDDEAIAAIEVRMEPFLQRIEEIEIDMAPLQERIEEIEARLQGIDLHIEDGTLSEVQHQLLEEMKPLIEQMESIHVHMEPLHEQIEAIHEQLEPLHEQLEDIHIEVMPHHEEIERLHEALEPFHDQMEAIHRDMEPIHEEMERLGDQLESAIRGDVAAVLRSHVGPVTDPGAPIDEAAARIVEEARVHVRDDTVHVDASRSEAREILSDLLAPHRIGSQNGFDAALDGAADALSPLEIRVD